MVGRRRRPALAAGGPGRHVSGRAGRTLGFELLDHPDQQLARIGRRGRQAFGRVHRHLHSGGGHLPPGQAHQAAGQRIGAAIDIAHLPDQAGILDILALDGQAKHGARQRPAALVQRQQLLTVQQLAARHAIGVEDEQLDQLDIGVIRQEVLSFLHGGESRHVALACANSALGVRTAGSMVERLATADKDGLDGCGHGAALAVSRRARGPVDARDGSATAPRRRG